MPDDILMALRYVLIITVGLCAMALMLEIVFDVIFGSILKKPIARLKLKLRSRKAKRMANNGHYCSNCLYSHKVKGSSYNTCDRTLKKTPVFSETAGGTYEVSSELAKHTYATNRCKWVGKEKADGQC